ncbi:DUF2200 domain-containing protein [Rhodococcus sp. Leaf233]|uniref:DUF2200 domain-containing protein n=1 Tax=Rhodococcus sp. Leaf233 TaxID=1736302 RepID=UPI00070F3696|nr:DUF2200 domain-containing protein [Rhodococcus sp. Leaf233]KQU32715.1 hypothetical protein ASH04_11415 [Rhodococcus sp. Leaf233]
MHNIFTTAFVTVHRLYINKVVRKGRTAAEVDEIVRWFTGFNQATLDRHLEAEDFFAAANLNPNATLITGVVCGIRVENVEDPLMKKIRLLDKLIDELAKGKAMEKILRG